jgi:hypothetical protein
VQEFVKGELKNFVDLDLTLPEQEQNPIENKINLIKTHQTHLSFLDGVLQQNRFLSNATLKNFDLS